MRLLSLCCLALLGMALVGRVQAQNPTPYDEPWKFECGDGKAIGYMRSTHDNKKEDRIWHFGCKSIGSAGSCCFSGEVNEYDKPVEFKCPDNQVLSGISSKHDNRKEDRVWKFQCCDNKVKLSQCISTGFINNYDEELKLSLSGSKVIHGVYSYHDNKKEDRRWKFLICMASTPTPPA